ncbi:MAG: hypothetical protein AAGA56_02555, partial [Myxococcota bacterium]
MTSLEEGAWYPVRSTMSGSLAIASKPIALELHQLLKDIDPSRWSGQHDESERTVRERAADLAEQFLRFYDSHRGATDGATVLPLIEQAGIELRERLPQVGLPRKEFRSAWEGYRKRIGDAYERLSVSFRAEAVELPTLRPTNYTRSLFHVGAGLGVLLLIEEVLGTG